MLRSVETQCTSHRFAERRRHSQPEDHFVEVQLRRRAARGTRVSAPSPLPHTRGAASWGAYWPHGVPSWAEMFGRRKREGEGAGYGSQGIGTTVVDERDDLHPSAPGPPHLDRRPRADERMQRKDRPMDDEPAPLPRREPEPELAREPEHDETEDAPHRARRRAPERGMRIA